MDITMTTIKEIMNARRSSDAEDVEILVDEMVDHVEEAIALDKSLSILKAEIEASDDPTKKERLAELETRRARLAEIYKESSQMLQAVLKPKAEA